MTSPLLSDSLPVAVEIGGGEYPIRWQHHIGIRFEELLHRDVPDETKVALAIGLYFPDTPQEDFGLVIDAMLDFYRCGKVEPSDESSQGRLYSFTHDYDLIYAGFVQAYGIDLFTVTDFHWWKFRSMLMALPDDVQFMKVVGYRAIKISSDMSKEQQKFYRRMKRLYALPVENLERRASEQMDWRERVKAIHAEKYDV